MPVYTASYRRPEPGYGAGSDPQTRDFEADDEAGAIAQAAEWFALTSRGGGKLTVALKTDQPSAPPIDSAHPEN